MSAENFSTGLKMLMGDRSRQEGLDFCVSINEAEILY
jgi:hypothetical protein